jgi:hypothetical protein
MSNGDFEVMPRGTIEELKELRNFVSNMTTLNKNLGAIVPPVMRARIEELHQFYTAHLEKYPV